MSRRSGSSPQNYNRPTTRACLRATVNTALLSPDILSTVMVWLGVPDLARVTRVCHAWKEAATLRLRDSRRSRGLYAVGGCYGGPHPSSSLSLSTVQRYNPTTGTTHSLAALSQGRDHLGLAATGGQARLTAMGIDSSHPTLSRGVAPFPLQCRLSHPTPPLKPYPPPCPPLSPLRSAPLQATSLPSCAALRNRRLDWEPQLCHGRGV